MSAAACVCSGLTYISRSKSNTAAIVDRRRHHKAAAVDATTLLSFPKRRGGGGGGRGFCFIIRAYPHSLLFGSWSSTSRKGARRRSTAIAMEWQECSSEIEVDVPCSVAYECYSDRESIPKWMPFISSVKVSQEKPDLSRWSLNMRGAVRFYLKGPSACRILLTVSYEVPEILIPVASALKPFLEGLIAQSLERFAAVVKEYKKKILQT